jgi:hypothetical protein
MYSEELHNLYSSPNTILLIKSQRMRYAVHVARTGDDRYNILLERSEKMIPFGTLFTYPETILKEILTAMVMKRSVLCYLKPRIPVKANRYMEGTYRLHLHK